MNEARGALLRRPRNDQILAGALAAIARYFGLDTFRVRLAYFLLTLISGGVLIFFYFGLWYVIPAETSASLRP